MCIRIPSRTSCCFPCVRIEKKQKKNKNKQTNKPSFTLSFNLVKVQDWCIFKEILGYILSCHPIQALTGFYYYYFFFLVEVEFEFDLGCFVFLLTAMRVGKSKLFVLRIVIWNSNCLLRISSSNGYKKPYNYVQANYYY